MDIKQAYEHIINWPSGISVFDCDSTVICGKNWPMWETLTTGEGLSDVALALWRRIWNMSIMEEVDAIAQKAMSTPWAVFQDSLHARFEILRQYWLQRQDVQAWAWEALFSEWFAEFIQLKNWLKKERNLQYQPYFFLSGGFEEMLIECLSHVVKKTELENILFANVFAYEWENVVWFDTVLSKMYLEGAKKAMVEKLRLTWDIPFWVPVYGVGDGSNDVTMSDSWYFVAYTGVKRREKVVEIAAGVEAMNFFEIAVFHTNPEERKFIYDSWNLEMIGILEKWKTSLKMRVEGLNIG